ncbi:MAG: hypothetical protein ABI593_00625 [Betaproteobacteria bacterium]
MEFGGDVRTHDLARDQSNPMQRARGRLRYRTAEVRGVLRAQRTQCGDHRRARRQPVVDDDHRERLGCIDAIALDHPALVAASIRTSVIAAAPWTDALRAGRLTKVNAPRITTRILNERHGPQVERPWGVDGHHGRQPDEHQ